MRSVFITGTDTGVGKTWTTCTLLQLLRERGIAAGAYKAVCSGAEFRADGSPYWGDVEQLRASCVLNPSETLVCPQRFLAPVAPNLAAALEQRSVDEGLLSAGAAAWQGLTSMLLIEGAGGLYCPLTDRTTVLDLIQRLGSTAIVVAGNRLGCISHSRMTVELLMRHGIGVAGVILNDVSASEAAVSDQSLAHNAAQLQHWIPDPPLLTSAWNSRELRIFSGGKRGFADVASWLDFAFETPAGS
jgi:dethiobiotin synthetase